MRKELAKGMSVIDKMLHRRIDVLSPIDYTKMLNFSHKLRNGRNSTPQESHTNKKTSYSQEVHQPYIKLSDKHKSLLKDKGINIELYYSRRDVKEVGILKR